MFGELIPIGGGDPIPLLKKNLRVGRRESCDIVLRFANVSAYHCMLAVDEGYWFVTDLNSRNGIKIDGVRIPRDTRKRLDPGDVLHVAKHKYEVRYSPTDLGAIGPPPQEDRPEHFLNIPLLERAGLQRRKLDKELSQLDSDTGRRKRDDLEQAD
ncbi:MAG: FHA domain-containing protein [Planctomycetes bacterium]|nr:FHA domain-containing protein [Planctomycetota bacterium]